MSTPAVCRVCLASNTKMHHIADTRYQEIFERLATKLHTADKKPEALCYICLAQLQKCLRFVDMSRKAEGILTQFAKRGVKLTEETVSILDRKFVRKYTWTPLQVMSTEDCNVVSPLKVKVKVEPCENETVANETEDNSKRLNTHSERFEIIVRENDFDIPETQNERYDILVKEEPEDAEIYNERLNTPSPILLETEILVKEEVVDENDVIDIAVKEEIIKQELIQFQEGEFEIEVSGNTNYDAITDLEPIKRQKHACNFCKKAYIHKCHLYRHLKTHQLDSNGQPSRNYTCERCGKAFIQKSTLKKHLLTHTDEKRFACDQCPTKCNEKIDMVRHMRMHTGQKPFSCDICKQTFSRKSNMSLHIQTHADNKPFDCHICKNTFSRRYDLNRHIKRKHIGEKPYTCDICDFRSVNASYMKTHVKNIHLKGQGPKPYMCNVCDFKCDNAGYLKLHVIKKHSNVKSKPRSMKIKKIF